MIWATVSSRSCFADSVERLHLWLQRIYQSDFSVDCLVISMCGVISEVIGKGLLWPACSLDKTLLAFSLLHFLLQGQTSLLFQVFLDFLLLRSNPLWWKGHLFLVLILQCAVGHLTSQLQLLCSQWFGHRLVYVMLYITCTYVVHRLVLVMLNGYPWKWTEIILLFLRLHPSTAFRTLVDYEG